MTFSAPRNQAASADLAIVSGPQSAVDRHLARAVGAQAVVEVLLMDADALALVVDMDGCGHILKTPPAAAVIRYRPAVIARSALTWRSNAALPGLVIL